MVEQLKPCPFCGGKAVLRGYKIDYRVMCKKCSARSRLTDNPQSAVKYWNARSDS